MGKQNSNFLQLLEATSSVFSIYIDIAVVESMILLLNEVLLLKLKYVCTLLCLYGLRKYNRK